jgi:hypothetical protein
LKGSKGQIVTVHRMAGTGGIAGVQGADREGSVSAFDSYARPHVIRRGKMTP